MAIAHVRRRPPFGIFNPLNRFPQTLVNSGKSGCRTVARAFKRNAVPQRTLARYWRSGGVQAVADALLRRTGLFSADGGAARLDHRSI
ncbi:hypothetical protein ACU5AX_09375 [Sphingomonas sp. XXL09]|uniref:hypothetical protein n=1 Tax=Sphingomonas sp. XXL09 TaxID=3457787 RepID=UPI00406BB2CF